MGSVALLLLSASQSRYTLLLSLRSTHQPYVPSSRRACHSHFIERSSVATKAGLGRFSGAIHGNSQRKTRRRRPPVQQQDQYEENRSDNENYDPPIGQQESDDNLVTAYEVDEIHDDGSPHDSEDESHEQYLQEIRVIKDVDSSGGFGGLSHSSNGSLNDSQSISHKRYLQEMRLTTETYVSAGQGENIKARNKLAGNGRTSRGKRGKKTNGSADRDSGIESVSVDEVAPVAATVLTSPDLFQEPSLVQADDTTSIDIIRRLAENGSTSGKRTDVNSLEFESLGLVYEKNATQMKKKQVKTVKKKLMGKKKLVAELPSKLEDNIDEVQVRVVGGGAERPSISIADGAEPLSESRPNKEPVVNLDATMSMSVEGVKMTELLVETAQQDSDQERKLANKVNTRALKMEMQVEASVGALFPGVDVKEEEFRLSGGSLVVGQTAQVGSQVVDKVVEKAVEVGSKVVELPVVLVEQASQVGTQMVEQVVEIIPDTVTEQVVEVVNQVAEIQTHVLDQVLHLGQIVLDQVSEAGEAVVDQVSDVAKEVANTVNEQVQQVADSVSSTATQVADDVTTTASQVVEQVTELFGDDDDSDSEDEFETYKTSDLPEFRGKQGLDNFVTMQEGHGILSSIHDFYTFMLKQPLPEFAAAMFMAPILVSTVFTLLYLPQFEGLAFDETARDFFTHGGVEAVTLHISWKTVFQVFMFSLSLSTGLQPELAPLSPYTLVVANINALVAQLVFVFLSGAVFARLSQPSQPIKCSTVALVCTSHAQRRRKENAIKVLMARYVLAGPQPCELVDVKVDLTYKYNTITRSGSYFRATQSLKLVRPEIAFLTHGMLIRHVIDEMSPLYQRTPEMLRKEDAVFCLSVVGLERTSMQSVFHVQHYCVVDNDVIWDAEFEDIILISKKNKRVVDHSRLSLWRPHEKEVSSSS